MIFLYHKVDLTNKNYWYVSVDLFAHQLACLRTKNVVYLDDYNPADPDHVVITFDGIYENVWRYAAPLLKRYGYPYELFIIGDCVGGDNAFDAGQPLERFATHDMLIEMAAMGARIQWHTRSHVRLQSLAQADLWRELEVPDDLKRLFPRPNLQWFAYPHDVDAEHRAVSEVKARFVGALACVAGSATDRYCLNRVTVAETTAISSSTVSIIIANYNYGVYLSEAVDSVLRQSYPPDEILVIDDASTDGSLELLAPYRDRVRIIVNETNLGIVGNFCKAVSSTTGDYIGFLGADNRMRSDYVELSKAALDAEPEAAIAYCDMAIFGPLAPALALKVGAKELRTSGIFLWQFPDPMPELLPRLRKGNFIHGSSMYRRTWYERVGGYQANSIAEDWHLFKRMVEAGGKAVRVPQPLIEYRQHSSAQANTVLNLQRRVVHLSLALDELRKRSRDEQNSQTSLSIGLERSRSRLRQLTSICSEEQAAAAAAAVYSIHVANNLPTDALRNPLPSPGRLDFKGVANGLIYGERGFSLPEPNGIWLLGSHAVLQLPLEFAIERFFRLRLVYAPFTSLTPSKALKWRMSINQHLIETFEAPPASPRIFTFEREISAQHLQPRDRIGIEFDFDEPMSPKALGVNADSRELTIRLIELSFEYR